MNRIFLKSKLSKIIAVGVITTVCSSILTGAVVHKPSSNADTLPVALSNTTNVASHIINVQPVLYPQRKFAVSIEVDSTKLTTYTTPTTIATILDLLDVSVGKYDVISPEPNTFIDDNTSISIQRIDYATVVSTQEVVAEVIYTPTPNLADGVTRLLKQGNNGLIQTEHLEKYVEGVLTNNDLVSSKTIIEATPYEYLIGDSSHIPSEIEAPEDFELDENGNPVNYLYKVTGKATAYSALGKPTSLTPGCVAMDLSMFPRGSKVYIKTEDGSYVYGYSRVADTGTSLVEGTVLVDVFFDSYLESCLFGAKIVDVYVIE